MLIYMCGSNTYVNNHSEFCVFIIICVSWHMCSLLKTLEHQLLAGVWDGSAFYPPSTLSSSTNFSNSDQEFLIILCLQGLCDLKGGIFKSGVQTPEISRTDVKKKDEKRNTPRQMSPFLFDSLLESCFELWGVLRMLGIYIEIHPNPQYNISNFNCLSVNLLVCNCLKLRVHFVDSTVTKIWHSC